MGGLFRKGAFPNGVYILMTGKTFMSSIDW